MGYVGPVEELIGQRLRDSGNQIRCVDEELKYYLRAVETPEGGVGSQRRLSKIER